MSDKNKGETNKKSSDYLYKVERVCGNGSFGIVFQAKVWKWLIWYSFPSKSNSDRGSRCHKKGLSRPSL